jgi:hypothetical protein
VKEPFNLSKHRFSLIFEDEYGDFWRCSCGEQGFDFEQGKEGFREHLKKANIEHGKNTEGSS